MQQQNSIFKLTVDIYGKPQKEADMEDFQLFISKNLNHLQQNPAKDLNEPAERMKDLRCLSTFMVIVDNQQ